VTAATERELLATLVGTFTLDELYAAVERADLTSRDDGHAIVKGKTDTRWKHRVRGALQGLKAKGRAARAGDRVWVIEGPTSAPSRAVMVSLSGTRGDIELRLQRAADLLADLDDPADLILADPPYGLGVGTQAWDRITHAYGRDDARVVGGYEDVDPARYRDFTSEWVAAAAPALRPGGQLAVVTGPQQAAWTQVAAEDAGLTYVNSITVAASFPMRTTRRFAHAHWTVTVMCRGRLDSDRRVFNPPPELPRAKSGRDYPLDVWPADVVGRGHAKPGELRYSNSLPEMLVRMLVRAFTRPAEDTDTPDHVVDPFLGGGTTALVCALLGLRFTGGDVNPRSLAFGARRLSRALGATPPPVATPTGQLTLAL
jgi:DNA modification methylase